MAGGLGEERKKQRGRQECDELASWLGLGRMAVCGLGRDPCFGGVSEMIDLRGFRWTDAFFRACEGRGRWELGDRSVVMFGLGGGDSEVELDGVEDVS